MKYEVISDDGSSSSNDLRKAGIMDFSSYSLSHTHSFAKSKESYRKQRISFPVIFSSSENPWRGTSLELVNPTHICFLLLFAKRYVIKCVREREKARKEIN
jgi:hypothetical protein